MAKSEMALGERIRQWREALGVAQYELAAGVGVSGPSVCSWEKGHTDPTTANLIALVRFLGLSMAEFWGPPGKRTARAS